jgi:hypothetical protein
MVQYAEPSSTITSGGWSYTGGSSLHDSTDCDGSPPSSNDTHYATIDGADVGGGASFEVKLESVTDPGIDTDFYIYIRSRVRNASGAGEKIDAFLYEGATQRSELWINYQPTDNTFSTDTIGLSSADVANISDFTDLRVRITIDTLGSGEDCDVSMILLEAPDVSLTNGPIDQTLASFTQNASGQLLIIGTLVQSLSQLTQTSTAGLSDIATITQTLQSFSQSLTGGPVVNASISHQLGMFAQESSGGRVSQGQGVQTLSSLTQVANGLLLIQGSISQNLALLNQVADAKALIIANIEASIDGFDQSLDGGIILTVNIDQSLMPFSQSGLGYVFSTTDVRITDTGRMWTFPSRTRIWSLS